MVARLPTDRCLTPKTMNQAVQDAAYAVRGPIPLRAEEIREEIEEDQANGKKSNRTFSHVLNCNIGNPQQLGQIPITFLRQVSLIFFGFQFKACNVWTIRSIEGGSRATWTTVASSQARARVIKRAENRIFLTRSRGIALHWQA